MFVIDSSSSVGANNFASLRQFVISLIREFRFSRDGGAQVKQSNKIRLLLFKSVICT